MNLYQIDKEIETVLEAYEQGIEEVVDTETGEIKSLADYLEELNLTKETKINNLGCYCKNTQYLIENLKTEKKKLDERIKVAAKKLERVMNYLQQVTEGKKFESPQFVISYRKSKSVEISEGAVIPKEYLVPQEPKPNKAELKKAIEGGKVIKGVQVVEKLNMSVK